MHLTCRFLVQYPFPKWAMVWSVILHCPPRRAWIKMAARKEFRA
jgi:hypothetical protein